MRERTIVMSAFSKTFSVTGWRLGYVTADAQWMAAMAYFHDLTYVCAPSAFQHAAAAGLEQLPPSFYTQLARDHQDKRARILSALRDAGMEPSVPAGAYYVLAGHAAPRRNLRRKSPPSARRHRSSRGRGSGLLPARPWRRLAALLLRQKRRRPRRRLRATAAAVGDLR